MAVVRLGIIVSGGEMRSVMLLLFITDTDKRRWRLLYTILTKILEGRPVEYNRPLLKWRFEIFILENYNTIQKKFWLHSRI